MCRLEMLVLNIEKEEKNMQCILAEPVQTDSSLLNHRFLGGQISILDLS